MLTAWRASSARTKKIDKKSKHERVREKERKKDRERERERERERKEEEEGEEGEKDDEDEDDDKGDDKSETILRLIYRDDEQREDGAFIPYQAIYCSLESIKQEPPKFSTAVFAMGTATRNLCGRDYGGTDGDDGGGR